MKRTLSIFLSALMLLSSASVIGASATDEKEIAKVSFNSSTAVEYYVGTSIDYSVKMTTPCVIENGQFKMNYTSDVLQIEKVAFPVVNDTVIYNYTENLTDELRFNYSNINPGYDFTKGDTLVTVTFKVLKAGDATVKLETKDTDEAIVSDMNDNNVITKTTFEDIIPETNVVKECTHANTKIVGKKAATYFAKGYTGNKVCADCGKVLTTGKATAKKTLKKPTIKATAGKKKIVVTYKKITGAKKYQVAYKLKTAKKWTKKTTTKLKYTISKLKKAKKYNVKVRAMVTSGKKTAYSSFSKTKTVKVK